MRKTKWSLLLVLMLTVGLVLAACSGGGNDDAEDDVEDSQEDEPKVLNLLDGAEIPTMDSSLASDAIAFQWLNETMEGLYRLGPDNLPVDGVAIKDETEISEDGTVWTFHLRDNAVWSNGDPVTANDFVFAWRRAIDPETGSEYGPFMMNGIIKNATEVNEGELPLEDLGVEALDDYTLQVTLEKAVPYFESLMTFGTFLPLNEDFVTEQGDQYALEAENLLFNGPFVMTEWKHEEGWTLEKNEDYWDADTVQLDGINIKVVKERSTAVNLYENGDIDRVGLASEDVERYRTHDDYREVPEAVLFYLKMNQAFTDGDGNETEDTPLANKDVRLAIAKAVNKQDLVDVILANGSKVSNAAVPEGFSAHPETGEDFRSINGDLLTHNVEEAQAHWADALAALGTDTVELELLGGDSDTAKEMQEYIKNQLETNLEGLTVNLTNVPFKERLDRDTNRDYELQFSGWGPDYLDPNTWLEMWTTGNGYNKMGFSNEEFDTLVEQANNELLGSPVERFEAFLEAEKVLMEDAAIAPLYQRSSAQLQRPYVKGVAIHPMGADYSYKWAYIEE
ncbi:peptide ABC transporter substrate-binding protein [Salirhabdus salicampi]|uniref:peptide ABC transporter substrate-binding protein n=1 Tax=Salirhabdus salicampi TaxID=476102 RepID=UPI0020C42160|nr:peptide ABC transporter substrate-binding protein [Salirhabdus salicampi]MCP8615574.1 peptide ABC transporter substrate-binding protein [Salirhabdus salicampi]